MDDINTEPNKLTKVSENHLLICFWEPNIPVFLQVFLLSNFNISLN